MTAYRDCGEFGSAGKIQREVLSNYSALAVRAIECCYDMCRGSVNLSLRSSSPELRYLPWKILVLPYHLRLLICKTSLLLWHLQLPRCDVHRGRHQSIHSTPTHHYNTAEIILLQTEFVLAELNFVIKSDSPSYRDIS